MPRLTKAQTDEARNSMRTVPEMLDEIIELLKDIRKK